MKKLIWLFGLLLATNAFATAPGYHVLKKISVGGEGFWDYLIVDNDARRLYVSHSSEVVVIDLESDKMVGEIKDLRGVHGIAIAHDLNRGFISCGQANMVVIFDLETLEKLGQVSTGSNPDAIRYDAFTKRVFAFNHSGNTATVIEAAIGEVAGTIELGGSPEFCRTDDKGKIYVNLEDISEVAEIDCKTLAVLRRFSLEPGEEPTGMGIDNVNHLIFSACSNQTLTVLDIETGKVIASVPIGQGCDGAGFDAETGLIFCSNGEGTLSIIDRSSQGEFEVAETVPTQGGARTMTVDPKTHNIYLPTAEFAPAAAPTPDNPRPRRQIVKDSFCILVVGK